MCLWSEYFIFCYVDRDFSFIPAAMVFIYNFFSTYICALVEIIHPKHYRFAVILTKSAYRPNHKLFTLKSRRYKQPS